MAGRLSRREISHYVADRILAGDDTILSQLAAYLIESRRTGELDLIVRDIEQHLADGGVVIADIATTHEPTEAVRKTLQQYITRATDASDVHMRFTTDASLLGGVRIRTAEAEYDATIQRQLTQLQAMKV